LSGSYPNPTLAATGVTPGRYTNADVTVDASGRIAAIASGASGGGGLTLPYSSSTAVQKAFEVISTNGTNGIALRGESNSTNTSNPPGGGAVFGINTNVSTSSPVYGVVGRVNSGFVLSAGVYGYNTATWGNSGGAGVYGVGYNGVAGSTSSPVSGASAIVGAASVGTAYAGYFTGGLGLYVNGNQTATGTKSAVVALTNGWRKFYCEEATGVYFNDYGTGRLVDGRAHIELDPLFLEAVSIDTAHPYQVFVQMNGETKGVYVLKSKSGFDVIETSGGSSNAAFDYRVAAKRKGFESLRMEAATGPIR
jgi:hypothetical protein